MIKPWLKFYDPDVPVELNIPATTLPDLLAASARNYPRHTATIFMGARLSYARLKEQVDRLAAGLHELGVRPGDRVAIMMPNCPQAIIAYYATLSVGGVAVMTNPLYVARELEDQWANAGVEFVISLRRFWPQLEAVRHKLPIRHMIIGGIHEYLPWFKRWLAPFKLRRDGDWVDVPYGETVHSFSRLIKRQRNRLPPVDIQPEDLACLQYTGGTTGKPKGAMLTHRNLMACMTQIREFLLQDVSDGEVIVLAILPFFHVYGMNAVMNIGIHIAAKLVLIPRPEMPTIIEAIREERPTFFVGIPALFVALNNYRHIDQVDLSCFKDIFSAAAPLPVEVMEEFERRTGSSICEAFGMTETSSLTHVNPRKGIHKAGSVGVPVTGTEAKIVDESDPFRPLEIGEEGEMMIRGPQVMRGYWNEAEETANVMPGEDWLRTGDIARMDKDGYFFIVDRKKDMILTSGYNVYPREVEEVLYQHPAVSEASVIGLPDKMRGEKVAAYVVLKPETKATSTEIRAFCRDRLAPYKQPRTVVFRESLPKSLAGKVLRRKLRAEALEQK